MRPCTGFWAIEFTTSPIGGTHSTSVDASDHQFGSTGTSRPSSTVQRVQQETIHEFPEDSSLLDGGEKEKTIYIAED